MKKLSLFFFLVISIDLLSDLKKDLDKVDAPTTPALPHGNTTNNVFVGSTTELQRMLKDINEKEVSSNHDAIDHRHDEE